MFDLYLHILYTVGTGVASALINVQLYKLYNLKSSGDIRTKSINHPSQKVLDIFQEPDMSGMFNLRGHLNQKCN